MKEKVFQLANIIEERWRQRARCKWLREGDKNTRYFHAHASARCRKNRVEIIMDERGRAVNDSHITEVFYNHLQRTIGTTNQGTVLEFDPFILYRMNPDLNDLDSPFTDQEIRSAIGRMAKNKASGPDGLTAEFLQKNLETLWPQIRQIVQDFHGDRLDLRVLNQANVVFIPKKDTPQEVSDFRPISIINVIPKLI